MNLYNLFKPIVFKWLTIISKGSNKKVVEKLLSHNGIGHVFHLPNDLCVKLFRNWEQKQNAELKQL